MKSLILAKLISYDLNERTKHIVIVSLRGWNGLWNWTENHFLKCYLIFENTNWIILLSKHSLASELGWTELLCLLIFNENILTSFVFKFHYSVDWAKALVEDVWIYHEVVVLCERRINVCRSLPQDTLYVSLLGNLWVDHQSLSWDILSVSWSIERRIPRTFDPWTPSVYKEIWFLLQEDNVVFLWTLIDWQWHTQYSLDSASWLQRWQISSKAICGYPPISILSSWEDVRTCNISVQRACEMCILNDETIEGYRRWSFYLGYTFCVHMITGMKDYFAESCA